MEEKIARRNSKSKKKSVTEVFSQPVIVIGHDNEQKDDDIEAATKKAADERARKKAEVRRRLEEVSRARKAKKGFLTSERKKKLRMLLMMKAAEDLKQQQLLREQERQRILQERVMPLPDLDNTPDEKLEAIAKQMAERLLLLESEHYDISYIVRQKDFEINELTISVNDLRGKFVKPTLKKVSKTDSKFNKLKKKDQNFVDFRTNLKIVESRKYTLEKEKKESIVDWKK